MCKLERNLNRIGSIIGVILIITVIMAMSSCGSSKMYYIGTGNELSKSNCTGNYVYKYDYE